MTLKPVIFCSLVAGLASVAAPLAAQEAMLGGLLTQVCLPYASRSQTFENTIRSARELAFRRPVGDTAPLEEWASAVDMVSWDGVWRVRIEEGTVEDGDQAVYQVSCTISSRRASARELGELGRRAFRDRRYWSSPADNAWRWERRSASPGENSLSVEVAEQPGGRPTLTVRGSYR